MANNRLPNDLFWSEKILEAAAENGNLDMMRYLLSRVVINWPNIFILRKAVNSKNIDLVKYLLTYRAFREAIVANWQAGQMNALETAIHCGQVETVQEFLKYNTVKQHITMRSPADFLEIYNNSAQKENINMLLFSQPSIFAYAEMHTREYGAQVTQFIEDTLINLVTDKSQFEQSNPTGVFDVSEEKAKLYFYIIRNYIRRQPPDFYSIGNEIHHNTPGLSTQISEQIDFLLQIPSVRNIAADNNNELLQLANHIGNTAAANILLAIPSVREQINQMPQIGMLDLRTMAADAESSMTALSEKEQKMLEEVNKQYQPMMVKFGGANAVFDVFYKRLQERYQDNPAKIQSNGKEIRLPLLWDDFNNLKLNNSDRELALKAYYQHPDHTAWRYLRKPNPWMHVNAKYVQGKPKQGQGYAFFEDYKSLIAMFYLATIDLTKKPINGHTIDTRLEGLIKELAFIGRAHNWDKTRTRKGKKEEYDDLEGDRPSCYSGTKRRLFQSVQGHPLFDILTSEKVNQALAEFAIEQVRS